MSNRFATVDRYIVNSQIRCKDLTNHHALLTNLARDWLLGEGPCEIQPVVGRRLSAGRRRVPAARDSDLNYSQVEKERTLMQAAQKMGTVS